MVVVVFALADSKRVTPPKFDPLVLVRLLPVLFCLILSVSDLPCAVIGQQFFGFPLRRLVAFRVYTPTMNSVSFCLSTFGSFEFILFLKLILMEDIDMKTNSDSELFSSLKIHFIVL